MARQTLLKEAEVEKNYRWVQGSKIALLSQSYLLKKQLDQAKESKQAYKLAA